MTENHTKQLALSQFEGTAKGKNPEVRKSSYCCRRLCRKQRTCPASQRDVNRYTSRKCPEQTGPASAHRGQRSESGNNRHVKKRQVEHNAPLTQVDRLAAENPLYQFTSATITTLTFILHRHDTCTGC